MKRETIAESKKFLWHVALVESKAFFCLVSSVELLVLEII
jgi:hypothetical protein